MNRDIDCDAAASVSLSTMVALLERLVEQTERADLAGIRDVCLLLAENLSDLDADGKILSSDQFEILRKFPQRLSSFLDGSDAKSAESLLGLFDPERWPSPLLDEEKKILLGLLIADKASAKDTDGLDFTALNALITRSDGADIDALKSIADEIERISDLVGAVGMQDICLLIHENIMDLASVDAGLSDDQMTLLVSWCGLLNKYYEDKNNEEIARSLIKNTMNEIWSSALDENQAGIIAGMMNVSWEIGEDVPPEYDVGAGDYPILGEIAELVEDLNRNDADQIIALAETINRLGEIAGHNNLSDFQDSCRSLYHNLIDICAKAGKLSDAQYDLLKSWPGLAGDYLHHSDSAQYFDPLVAFINDPYWVPPSSDAVPEQMEPGVDDDNLYEQTLISNTEIIDELAKIKELVDMPAKPKGVNRVLVNMLLDEIKKIINDNQHLFDASPNENLENAVIEGGLAQYIVQIERFGGACQAAELDGIYQANAYFKKNISLLASGNALIDEGIVELMGHWLSALENYLTELGNTDAGEQLVGLLRSDRLPEPLMDEVSPALLDLLNSPYLSDEEIKQETGLIEATEQDVSIELPDDINQELLDGLLQELPDQTESFSVAIQTLLEGNGDMQDVEKAQRIAHTIKGAANTVGIRGIAVLTHQLEDILVILSGNNRLPSRALGSILMGASDCLEEMSEALLSRSTTPATAMTTLQSILDWAHRLATEGVSILDEDGTVVAEQQTIAVETKKKSADGEPQEEEQLLHVSVKLVDNLLRLMGEIVIVNSQLYEKVNTSKEQSDLLLSNGLRLQNLAGDIEKQIEVGGVAQTDRIGMNQDEVFDALEMRQYNELHSISNQLIETVTDIHEFNAGIKDDLEGMHELLINQERLNKQVHGMVMQVRMVPVKSIVPRLRRNVRQTCRTTGKQAVLIVNGADTLIDREILNTLINPLMHIMRNAVDHGIEAGDDRVSHGKKAEGRLEINFYREGANIVVVCSDDGKGLDAEKIRGIAQARGIISADDELTEDELYRLILRPGFSTREETTQTSGRGIGMDVVNTQLASIKGYVHIDSDMGKGATFELRMPATSITNHVLLVRSRSQLLAISNHGIARILYLDDSEYLEGRESGRCKVDNDFVDVSTLEELLGLPPNRRAVNRHQAQALLIHEEDIRQVVFIQDIQGSRDVVVKSMGKYLSNITGLLGSTILGDGSVVPVVDLPELLRVPYRHAPEHAAESTGADAGLASTIPFVLAVDDSLSARRALVQVMEDAGYNVRSAKDGLEALAIVEKRVPDIMLVDMEMPRMNGIELTSHVRGMDKARDLPIIMVTSRTTDKHRRIAAAAGVDQYMSKPFSSDEILGNVQKLLSR